jgi:hypothetical protein
MYIYICVCVRVCVCVCCVCVCLPGGVSSGVDTIAERRHEFFSLAAKNTHD